MSEGFLYGLFFREFLNICQYLSCMGLGIYTAVVIDHRALWVNQEGFTFGNFCDA